MAVAKRLLVMSFKLRSLNGILVEPKLLGTRAVIVYAVTALFYTVNDSHRRRIASDVTCLNLVLLCTNLTQSLTESLLNGFILFNKIK